MNTTNDAKSAQPQTALQWVKDAATLEKIANAAPTKTFDSARFLRGLFTEFAKVDKLALCSAQSFAVCAIGCAQLGLYPGAQQHIHLIPRKGQCTLIVGYRGLLHQVRRAMPGAFVDCFSVYENDDCNLVFGRMPEHRVALKDRGQRLGVVAACALPGSDYVHWKWIPADELEEIAQRFQGNFGPWHTDREQMELKTVLRRLCKILPTDRHVDELLALEDGAVIDVESTSSEPVRKARRPAIADRLSLAPASPSAEEEIGMQVEEREPVEVPR